jgi:DNA-binding CsgD family transcriptional regulator
MPMPKKKQYSSSYNPIVKDPRYQAVDNAEFKNPSYWFHEAAKSYQHIWKEGLAHDYFWAVLKNDQSIRYHFNPYEYNEQVHQLTDKLHERMYELVELHCTSQQIAVVKLIREGCNQQQAADLLGIGAMSVHQSLHGQKLKSGRKGGLIKRMRNLVARDTECQSILAQIIELREERL